MLISERGVESLYCGAVRWMDDACIVVHGLAPCMVRFGSVWFRVSALFWCSRGFREGSFVALSCFFFLRFALFLHAGILGAPAWGWRVFLAPVVRGNYHTIQSAFEIFEIRNA